MHDKEKDCISFYDSANNLRLSYFAPLARQSDGTAIVPSIEWEPTTTSIIVRSLPLNSDPSIFAFCVMPKMPKRQREHLELAFPALLEEMDKNREKDRKEKKEREKKEAKESKESGANGGENKDKTATGSPKLSFPPSPPHNFRRSSIDEKDKPLPRFSFPTKTKEDEPIEKEAEPTAKKGPKFSFPVQKEDKVTKEDKEPKKFGRAANSGNKANQTPTSKVADHGDKYEDKKRKADEEVNAEPQVSAIEGLGQLINI